MKTKRKDKELCIDVILAALGGKNPRASFLLDAMANLYLQELVRQLDGKA